MSWFSIFQLSHRFYGKIIWDLDKSASSTCFSFIKLGVLLPRCLSLCGDFGATPLLELRTRRSLPQMEFRVLELNIIKPNCTSNLTDSTPQKNKLFALFPQMIWFDTKGLWNQIRSKILLSQCSTAIVAPTRNQSRQMINHLAALLRTSGVEHLLANSEKAQKMIHRGVWVGNLRNNTGSTQTMHYCKGTPELPQNYHTSVVFYSPKMGNLMTSAICNSNINNDATLFQLLHFTLSPRYFPSFHHISSLPSRSSLSPWSAFTERSGRNGFLTSTKRMFRNKIFSQLLRCVETTNQWQLIWLHIWLPLKWTYSLQDLRLHLRALLIPGRSLGFETKKKQSESGTRTGDPDHPVKRVKTLVSGGNGAS